MNPDGISYIEMAEAAAAGQWHALVNGYWSPLYPFLIGVALRIFHPSLEHQFALVHAVNFAIYLASFAAFEVFLFHLIQARSEGDSLKLGSQPVPPRTLWMWGCLFFLWSSQFWLNLEMVTPDLCVAALVYLATALLLRLRRGSRAWLTFFGLGAVLGLAYLAKAAMFPLAIVFLVCAFLLCTRTRGSLRPAVAPMLAALVVFFVIASPFILVLSHAKGRPTFGDSGKIAYAEYLSGGAPLNVHWQGGPTGMGIPAHPTRKILSSPPLYEFAQPIAGSYPPWYDPSYWYEGIAPHFSLKGQLRVLFRAANAYLKMFSKNGALYVVSLAIFLIVRKTGSWESLTKEMWLIFLPSMAALILYALVLVEFRYVSPFALVLLLWILSRARVKTSANPKYLNSTGAVIVGAFAVGLMWPVGQDADGIVRSRPFEQWKVAQGLHKMGVPAGAPIGFIGKGTRAYWAHLAGLVIVAEIPEEGQLAFRAADDTKKQQVLEKFAESGAMAVVMKSTERVPAEDWQQIGETPYYLHVLPRVPSTP
jgi:hypothetical protein